MLAFGRPGVIRGATSILCVLLTLNLSLLTPGCGWDNNLTASPDGIVRIPLTEAHPITDSLKGTAFEGAQLMEVDMRAGSFRLLYPDTERTLSGQFVQHDGVWEMTSFSFQTSAGAARMTLDPNTRQVTMIETAEGAVWQPSKQAAPPARVRGEDRLDSYLASNEELLALSSHGDKSDDASFAFLPFAFFMIMIIWMLCANPIHVVCPGFLPIFLVIIAILGTIPGGATAPAPLPIVNNPPDARDDAFALNTGVVLTSELLTDHGSGADSDADGDSLSTSLATAPANGTANVGANGSFTYTPNAGFGGTDTFTYQLSDGREGTDTATVTIVINRAPDARNDAFTDFPEGAAVVGNLFASNGSGADSDPDGDAFTVTAVEGLTANVGVAVFLPLGTLTVMADGSFTFDDSGFTGAQTFTYTILDGRGGTDTATVTINIASPP